MHLSPTSKLGYLSFKDSRVALANSNPNACVPCRKTLCIIFIMVFDATHDLPHERWTR